jgi:transposase
VITIHKTKKLNTDEWVEVLKAGKFIQAVRKLKASSGRAPWKVLCDNESFLEAKLCRAEYKKKHLSLIHIPSKSPDLNPIESFWGWMRAQLRRRDLKDLRDGRPALGKMAYKVRLTRFLKTRRAQDVAKAKFNAFKKVCREVKNKRGAASRS